MSNVVVDAQGEFGEFQRTLLVEASRLAVEGVRDAVDNEAGSWRRAHRGLVPGRSEVGDGVDDHGGGWAGDNLDEARGGTRLCTRDAACSAAPGIAPYSRT